MKSNIVHGNFSAQSTVKVVSTDETAVREKQSCNVQDICPEKYEILERIGAGGMGTIYKARQILLDKLMAIKVLSRCDDANANVRFQVEAKAASSLCHPNLVTFRDFGITHTGMAYIVMDFIEGETLSERIDKCGPMEIREAIEIVLQALAGLQHAHQRFILHRDIKPSNIILSSNDSLAYVKIVDFGIAKIENSTQNLTHTGQVFGTPLYMSPEQGLGRQLDARSDLYSMGCVMYQMLTGTIPLVGNSAIETIVLRQTSEAPLIGESGVCRQFDSALEKWIAKMLAIHPDDRYQSAEEAAQALLTIKSRATSKATTGSGLNKIVSWAHGKFVKAQTTTRTKKAQ